MDEESVSQDISELIIHYVKSRPEIWDIRHPKYRDNFLKKKFWMEVANELNVTADYLKTRWKNLRDRYIKERKKLVTKSGQGATNVSRWPLMQSMDFLRDSVEPVTTITNSQIIPETPSVQLSTQESLQPSTQQSLQSSQPSVQSLLPLLSPPSPIPATPSPVSFHIGEHVLPIEELQVDNMWNNIQAVAYPSPSSHSSTISSRPASGLSRPASGLFRHNTISPSSGPAKRAKKGSESTNNDPIDKAILDLVKTRVPTEKVTADEHFFCL